MKRKVKDEDGYEEGHEVGDIVHRHSREQSIHDDGDINDVSQGKINSSNGIMTSRVKIEDNSKMSHMGGTTNGQLQLHLSKMIPERDRGRIKCPYLDTVNRQMIDFDSEKLCSITLTNMNVYVCLVCGKYFQGRGKTTPLFTHSVQAGHFVFMNLHSGRVYCLPDDYEVVDTSLRDVQRCLSPRYSLEEINALNRNTSLARDVHGVSYLPGFVGLNNLNSTDYINSLLHALAHVTPFRDYWLEPVNYELCKSNIVHRFGLVRNMFAIHDDDDDDHDKRMIMMMMMMIRG
jgi:U4/U6.U5 tri-snRNP-associated protein 2